MKTKTLVILGVALTAGLAAGAWKVTAAPEVGVSKVSNNPAAYVGNIKIVGKTGGVDPARGLLQLVDDKACCNLVIAVPFTNRQQAELGVDALYSGVLPQPGQPLEAHGVIRQVEGGYRLDVSKLKSGRNVLIRKV